MYKRMIEEGFTANATTYNALISAYGKAGQLDKVCSIGRLRMILRSYSTETRRRRPRIALINIGTKSVLK